METQTTVKLLVQRYKRVKETIHNISGTELVESVVLKLPVSPLLNASTNEYFNLEFDEDPEAIRIIGIQHSVGPGYYELELALNAKTFDTKKEYTHFISKCRKLGFTKEND